ncbi:aldehyde dehydrogenase [Thioclava dalianensis]|uniref:aldehyde dehydrogenase (NAD(+)) n=1 Tax=Thioclava dalianensis TaxID=1185766 RepID=A0A074U0M9_9RHOB|nr:aldehyde dehydrogenase family protein [Thioclava dalianensis]KEP68227.1 aldehyde dehydrogenase [Thioclava dalianensis]SFM92160.1 aldehyde dehydrogenase (NAD+) [Thioclava dalianensis]
MIEKRAFYINGEWVDPKTARDYTVIDPATEDGCAIISLGAEGDTDAAVAAAKAALPGWKATDPAERIAAVERIAEIYDRRADEMAQAISLEMGAPIDLARRNQVGSGSYHIANFLTAAKEFPWVHALGDGTPGAMIAHEAIGVVGLITPWNWPMNQVTLKAIPAILAGCTMVLKPSEEAPLSSLLFAELVDEAGLPPGVFNLVNGDGAGVGTQLSTHPDIEMISFTGSTRAGRAISKAAAETLKRVTLELGGKGANLIFADADEDAVARGVRSCFQNSGQSCNAPTRMLVERPIYDRAVEIARETAEATQVGNPRESGRHIGPVVNAVQFDKIQGLIETGIKEGAKLVAGGPGRPEALNRGFYVRPTVFADCDPSMTIMNEEIFGPVLSIMPFETEEQAIEVANATPYGLTNYLQSGDGARRNRLARALNSGMVEMNGQSRGAGAPFGGVGASGRAREGGRWGIEEFCNIKSIAGWAE